MRRAEGEGKATSQRQADRQNKIRGGGGGKKNARGRAKNNHGGENGGGDGARDGEERQHRANARWVGWGGVGWEGREGQETGCKKSKLDHALFREGQKEVQGNVILDFRFVRIPPHNQASRQADKPTNRRRGERECLFVGLFCLFLGKKMMKLTLKSPTTAAPLKTCRLHLRSIRRTCHAMLTDLRLSPTTPG